MQPLSSKDSSDTQTPQSQGSERRKELVKFQRELRVKFRRIDLLEEALSHSSFVNELPEEKLPHNEKLEFLGDAVLELIVSHELFNEYPEYFEGELTKLRAAVVRKTTLAKVAKALDIGPHILLGKGEEQGGGRKRNALLADALEAIIGALYLDGGLDKAREFILHHFADEIERLDQDHHKMDYKSILQEITQSRFQTLPRYSIVSETGPPHDRTYEVSLTIAKEPYGTGKGRNKKEAQQKAARAALIKLQD
jgi:ribonuclease-3